MVFSSHFVSLAILGFSAAFLGVNEAALPNDVEYCDHPDPNMPGSGWKNMTERSEEAQFIIYAKAVEKTDIKTSLFGQSYTVEWETLCVMKPGIRGFPSRFKMEHMGTFDPSDIVHCGNRKVKGGFNYIFYAKPDYNSDGADPYLIFDEVNNQTALFEIGGVDENGVDPVNRAFAEDIYHCLSGDHCHDDDDLPNIDPENEVDFWEPMSLSDRIKASEYAMEVHMIDGARGCVQCILNQPENPSGIQHDFKVNETLYVTEHESLCHDSDVYIDGGKRYIMLLTNSEINGKPNLKPFTLAPNEVNGQQAVYEVDSALIAELGDLLVNCPAEDYTCPAENPDEPEPEPTKAPEPEPTEEPEPEPTEEPEPEPTEEPKPDGSNLITSSIFLLAFLALFW